jgi:hypothetical protein
MYYEMLQRKTRMQDYRYYKCVKNTCKQVGGADASTINIPAYVPVSLDILLIRYQLKTFFPIKISYVSPQS